MISDLRSKQLVWFANEKWTDGKCIPTKQHQLDNAIGGGLPEQGIIEIKSLSGIGEVSLIKDYLIQKQKNNYLAFINTPGLINASALRHLGLELNSTIDIQLTDQKEQLWAIEQCLKSGLFSTVLTWITDITLIQLRRLALACETTKSSIILFTRTGVLPLTNTKLSLSLIPLHSNLKIQINKYRGKIDKKDLIVNTRSEWSHLYTYKRPHFHAQSNSFIH